MPINQYVPLSEHVLYTTPLEIRKYRVGQNGLFFSELITLQQLIGEKCVRPICQKFKNFVYKNIKLACQYI